MKRRPNKNAKSKYYQSFNVGTGECATRECRSKAADKILALRTYFQDNKFDLYDENAVLLPIVYNTLYQENPMSLSDAAHTGNFNVVEYIMNTQNPSGKAINDALYWTISRNDFEMFQYLFSLQKPLPFVPEEGDDTTEEDARNADLLEHCAFHGRIAMVYYLLDKDVFITDQAIYFAIGQDRSEIIKIFLEHPEQKDEAFDDIEDIRDVWLDDSVRVAALNCMIFLLEYLRTKFSRQDFQDVVNNCLVFASQRGHLSIVSYLIEQCGAQVHFQEDQPVAIAVLLNNYEVVRYLLENGADINVAENEAHLAPNTSDDLLRLIDSFQ